MAQLYGKASEYLLAQKLKNKYAALWVVLWIIPTLIVYWILGFYFRFSWSFTLIYVPFFLIFWKIIDELSSWLLGKAYRYKYGIEGENQVLIELLKLNDDYLIFRNIHLPDRKDDIDFVVLCPSGIYVVETKNIKGGLILDKTQKEGRRIIAQVTSQFWGLRDYIKRTTNLEIFVHPLIVSVQENYSKNKEYRRIEGYITLINHRQTQAFFKSHSNIDRNYHELSIKKKLEYLATQ